MTNKELNSLIIQALREDAANHDITTRCLIPANQTSYGVIIVKENTIICGLAIAKKVFQKLNRRVRFETKYKDGMKVKKNTIIAKLKGNTRCLLTGERTALNFLGYLSGIATNTHNFVNKASKAKIFDTRKTTPGLRSLEKYAVSCGQGHNHRFNLNEHVLIKDNHRDSCRLTIPESVKAIRRKTRKRVEIEVDNLNQFKQALSAQPDIILLDNMSCAQMKKAVRLNKKRPKKKRALLEASGGITLKNVRAIAQTGVERISIGSLTHTHKAINFSMELNH